MPGTPGGQRAVPPYNAFQGMSSALLCLAEYMGGEDVNFCVFVLPGIRGKAGFVAGLFEEGGEVPVPFRGNLGSRSPDR